MDSLEFWRASDELNIIQAALLVIGIDPASIQKNIEKLNPEEKPDKYEAAKTAIIAGIRKGKIHGELKYYQPYDEPPFLDLEQSFVDSDSLKEWLTSKNIRPKSIFSNDNDTIDLGFLDPDNPRYAPKLAAGVMAWNCVKEAYPKKREKASLEEWLYKNAAKFNLIDEKGEPLRLIEDIAAIANWDTSGGPPKS